MKRINRIILSTFTGVCGLYLIGISKQFNGYLVDSIWWQISNSFFIGIVGIIIILLSLKFALYTEGEEQ